MNMRSSISRGGMRPMEEICQELIDAGEHPAEGSLLFQKAILEVLLDIRALLKGPKEG